MKESAVGIFIEKVESTYEVDYGDFKRKLSLYIMRLEESLGGENNPVIYKMKKRAIYTSDGDIENTRHAVLELVKEL